MEMKIVCVVRPFFDTFHVKILLTATEKQSTERENLFVPYSEE